MSSSIGEWTNAAVMSNNPMYLASFWFLLAANANSARATASGEVAVKTSSRPPYATFCATHLAFTASPFLITFFTARLMFQQQSMFIGPFVVTIIQHAHFHSTDCLCTFALLVNTLHLAVFDLSNRSLVRHWQLYFHGPVSTANSVTHSSGFSCT